MGKTTKGKVYGYCRVSTAEQANSGVSLQAQRRQIAGYAQMQGWTITQTFVERGVSGARPLDDRKEGEALLAILKPGDVIIAAKLDRLFRSASNALAVLEQLKARKVSLHLLDLGGNCTTDGIGRLVFTIMSAVAGFERDRCSERIRDVKRDMRERGEYLGGAAPYGFRLHKGKLIEHEAEQKAIKRMLRLRQQGKSLRTIATAMKDTPTPLSHVGVRSLLRRQAATLNSISAP